MKLSNQPPKGTADWFPEEFRIRKYIFDTWREVCTRFGYEEYLTPIVESAEIYRAKSGEDVGGKELMFFKDRSDRELAIRPEMTPSVTRLVSQKYDSLPKPIRYFSIANFFRNEKPQRGRNREFWQLNFDIFGSNSINADVEILQIGLEIMQQFGADSTMFEMRLNDRQLVEAFVTKYLALNIDQVSQATRILDKFGKIENTEMVTQLEQLGASVKKPEELFAFLSGDVATLDTLKNGVLAGEAGMERLTNIQQKLDQLGFAGYTVWSPGMVRGFDYYDGMIFEVFDKNPENSRSLFGGGRYNGLAGIFGTSPFPAVGCAPGDETTRLFLEGWGLLANIPASKESTKKYIPILEEELADQVFALAQKLRAAGEVVEVGLEVQKMGKALEYANKRGIGEVIILGSAEAEKSIYLLKNMLSGEQVEIKT